LYEEIHTATNYSMISDRFCDFDGGWVLTGDSGHFVDPLFSSGVTFAVLYAASAALLVKASFDPELSEAQKRELWGDYEQDWRLTARSFALAIDQWYHAISRTYPGSSYWRTRADNEMADDRSQTFHALVNTELSTDLLHVLTKNTDDLARLDSMGPLARKIDAIQQDKPDEQDFVSLRQNVELKESLAIQAIRSAVATQKHTVEAKASRFWSDPDTISEGDFIYNEPIVCHRLKFVDGDPALSVRLLDDAEEGLALYEKLRVGAPYGELVAGATPHQKLLLHRIWRSGMLAVRGPA
jgi:hypothetical protein